MLPDVIQQAGELFQRSDLGRLKSLTDAWNTTKWQEVPHGHGLAAVHKDKPELINLFGDLNKARPKARLRAIMAAFGASAFERLATAEARDRWERKLTLPEAAHIDAVQEKLPNLDVYPTYRSIMESFPSLLERYTSLNLTNALRKNGITRDRAVNLNLRRYGCTMAYANIRATHQLVPFLTGYGCPRTAFECPGHALAEKLVDGMGHMTESSLAKAFDRLISEVFALCREEEPPTPT